MNGAARMRRLRQRRQAGAVCVPVELGQKRIHGLLAHGYLITEPVDGVIRLDRASLAEAVTKLLDAIADEE